VKERDQTWNIPLERREQMLSLLHSYGIHYVFAGHVHKYGVLKDGDLDIIEVGAIGTSYGKDGSGMMIAEATDTGIQHHYFDFGRLPNKLSIK
jgi:serine/threonine-protein phosphatase CPPED1